MKVKRVPKRIQIEIKSSFYNFLIFFIFFYHRSFFSISISHWFSINFFITVLSLDSPVVFSIIDYCHHILHLFSHQLFGTFHQFVNWFSLAALQVGFSTGLLPSSFFIDFLLFFFSSFRPFCLSKCFSPVYKNIFTTFFIVSI